MCTSKEEYLSIQRSNSFGFISVLRSSCILVCVQSKDRSGDRDVKISKELFFTPRVFFSYQTSIVIY